MAVLEAVNVSKSFGPVHALREVNLRLERGQILGFLGPNGSGKTTTMRAVMGLITIDSGWVSWDGEPVTRLVRHRFGYMPAERGMYPQMGVRDHLIYYARLSGTDPSQAARNVDDWIERVGLRDRADDAVETLSTGNQQRVQLLLALINNPTALILDEPFSGLDPIAVDMLSDILRDQAHAGVALLLSSHQLDLVADVCDTAVIIDQGQVIADGTVQDLRARSSERFVTVEFASPTAWVPSVGAVYESSPTRVTATIAPDEDPSPLIREAHAAGPVMAFSYAPPDLSDVFLHVLSPDADAGALSVIDDASENGL